MNLKNEKSVGCIMMQKPALLLLIFFLLYLSGCEMNSNNTSEEPPDKKILVSEEFSRTITQQQLELFWSEAGRSEVSKYVQYDVDLYRIVYTTEDDGRSIEASGAIIVPKGIDNPGLLSIQHATIFSNDEAPSVNTGFSAAVQYSIFASAGYIAFLPDYIGYGITNDRIHPYQQANSLATASYDMLRAGLEFVESNGFAEIDQPVNMIGYSEGAYATLALAHLVETTESEITPGFLSMGAGIFDLTGTSEFFLQNIDKPTSCLACYAFFLYSYHQKYNFSRPLSDYFQSPYDQIIADGLFDGSLTSHQIKNELPDLGIDLFHENFIYRYSNGEETELRDASSENNILYIPDADVLLVHGNIDSVAPVFNSDDFNDRAIARGKSNIEYIRLEGAGHSGTVFPWGLGTLNRLAGEVNVASE